MNEWTSEQIFCPVCVVAVKEGIRVCLGRCQCDSAQPVPCWGQMSLELEVDGRVPGQEVPGVGRRVFPVFRVPGPGSSLTPWPWLITFPGKSKYNPYVLGLFTRFSSRCRRCVRAIWHRWHGFLSSILRRVPEEKPIPLSPEREGQEHREQSSGAALLATQCLGRLFSVSLIGEAEERGRLLPSCMPTRALPAAASTTSVEGGVEMA